MSFVNRDENNKIIEIFACRQYEGQEEFNSTENSIDDLKHEKLNLNKNNYINRWHAGKEINGIKFDINDQALIRLSAELQIITSNKIFYMLQNHAEAQPQQIVEWSDFNNNIQTFTEDEFISTVNVIRETVKQIEFKNSNNITTINNASTEEELNNINLDFTNI